MMTPPTKPGDIFLLFEDFPYEFDSDLPLPIGPCVYLDETPHAVLQSVKLAALADFVLPGYNLGSGAVNCCFRSSSSEARQLNMEVSNLFFKAIIALRLCAPIPIHIAGQFELGEPDMLIKDPGLFYLRSAWQPNIYSHYKVEDIHFADKIARRQIEIADNKYKRVISAIVLYFQATCGPSTAFQLSYLGLFAALESLFVPNGNKAKTLAGRAENFLSNFDFSFQLVHWLEKEYKTQRGKLAHGIQDVIPRTKLEQSELETFGRLHELTRLSILGFLSLENGMLEKLSSKNGSSLQNELDNLPVAAGAFLQNQKPFCA